MFFLRAVQFWIVVSTLASVAGWTLSAVGMLNKTGYLIFAAVIAVAAFIFRRSSLFAPVPAGQDFRKLGRRVRRFLPASVAILAALVFLSGLLYAPNDHTGLSYRLPRVLQWLQHGSWYWIHTPNYRMNDRSCGIEWLSAPFLLFLKSDRALFLLNFIPFLLMPGLIFSVWTRLGVRPRVAWNWMWLLPTGYCFLLQAGGIANDSFPTVYGLAMMDFALRARDKYRVSSVEHREGWTLDLGLSLLSAALLVGAKVSNSPLGLAWALVVFPLLPGLFRISSFRFRISAVFLLLIALVISFVPNAILNILILHDWSGLSIEHPGMDMKNPIAGIVGNAVLLVTNNFVPTFFPMAHWWNEHALSHFPAALAHLMTANFEDGYNILGEMPTEDWAGIGFGLSALVVISLIAQMFQKRKAKSGKAETETNAIRRSHFPSLTSQLILIAPWVALVAYCMKSGMVTPARLIAPYYPFLFPLLLVGAGQSRVVRSRWFKVLAAGVLLLALAALIVEPSRPLWPANTILAKAVARHPEQRQLLRAQTVYRVYRDRPDPLAWFRQSFPPDLKIIGFLGTKDDLDISMWKPYGSRCVEYIWVEDPPEQIRKLGIQYAVVSGMQLDVEHSAIDQWLQKADAELITTTNITLTVAQGPEPWYLVRFKP